MDVQGSKVAKPYVEKAHADYIALVDSENLLADLVGFKVVPNTFLIDETGRFIKQAATREEVEAWVQEASTVERALPESSIEKVSDEARLHALETLVQWVPTDGNLWLQLAEVYRLAGRYDEAEVAYRKTLALSESSSAAHFRYGRFLLARGRSDEALTHLRQALQFDPRNYVIRKQIWAIEHPERFYEGPIDWDWQHEQMKQKAQ